MRQQPGTKHGRDGERDDERSRESHDVREPERPEQTSFDAAQHEERQEHQRDDDRGEHDGVADLGAGAVDDLENRPAL